MIPQSASNTNCDKTREAPVYSEHGAHLGSAETLRMLLEQGHDTSTHLSANIPRLRSWLALGRVLARSLSPLEAPGSVWLLGPPGGS